MDLGQRPMGPVAGVSEIPDSPAAQDGEDDSHAGNPVLRFFTDFRHPGPWHIAGITATLAILIFGGLFLSRWMHRLKPQSLGVVMADFQNSTGNPQFDSALRTATAIDLQQSPYLVVEPEAKVEQTLGAMRSQANQVAASELAREVCQRLNDQVYLTGEIHRLASKYLFTFEAFDCSRGSALASSRGIADSQDGVVPVLDRVVDDLRKQLGESAKSVARFSKPLFAGRASSLDALKAYADGEHLALAGRLQDAVPLLRRAVEIDPAFTMAYADLGEVYSDLGEHDLAVAALSHAYELRNTVDERDRFFVTSTYNEVVTGDIQASIHNYKEWSEEYPYNPAPFLHLADFQVQVGKPALALAPAQHALALSSSNALTYVVLARAQMHLGQFEQAADTCHMAISRHLDDEQIHAFLLQIAFLRLDQQAIDEQLAWAKGTDAEPFMQLQQALMDFAQGKAKAAAAIFTQVAEGYRKLGQEERANRALETVPRIEAELGLTDASRALLARLPSIDGSTDIPVAFAHVGEATRAESLLKGELDSHLANTLWQAYRGPQIRAAIALNEQFPEEAVDDLKLALPYDLRGFDVPALRGRAYLMAREPSLAEAEFHKILDHSGIDPLSHDYPLAQLGVARALAQEGKIPDAEFAYKLVLQIWKDADPDLPRLKEAKAEYARLNNEPLRGSDEFSVSPARKPPSGRRR